MRSGQDRASASLAVAVVSGAVVLLGGAPAHAGDIFVQVTPSTVQAGYLVGIRASCQDNSTAARVESAAFGAVEAQPQDGVLSAAALVPEETRPGSYRVKLNCPRGGGASASLIVLAGGQPRRGPATGFGGGTGRGSGIDPGQWLLPGGVAAILAGLALGLSRRRAGAATGRR